MSTRIALIGAGGKMGCRVTDNFLKQSYAVDYVEVSETGWRTSGHEASRPCRRMAPSPPPMW